ncbi:porin family protein [Natronoflexus pectinivorans]|uniref:Outer membrane protein with beta-barrel domain n=1 Tax=Natronoflexus pectinivorans TaxID=682526 RepID=A0A4R2GG96_9BACT|nr:porin family protein [Natronoflexus pectinivorans]TCO07265.1 outer membrane protein with beta-barrel domain [Natronoflexus pectinivorans]
MKTLISIAIIVFLSSNYLDSQNTQYNTEDSYRTDSRENFYFGAKIGTNYSNVYDTQGEEFVADSKFGIATGVFVSIPIGKNFGVQPEILFTQKGFKGTGRILGEPYELTRTTNHIDIPIYLQLKPIKYVSILAGPQYSYLIKQKDVFETASSSIETQEEFLDQEIRKNTFGFTGGLDFNFEHIVLGTRIGWDLLKNNGDGSSETPRYRNVWYQFTLGYRFHN